MALRARLMVTALAPVTFTSVVIAAIAACSSSGSSPQDRCQQFLNLTQDCFAKAGRQVSTNPAACGDPNTVTPQVQAQIDCSLQHQDAYCKTIEATSPDAGITIDPRDPDLLALNSCIAEATTASPCKEAIHALSQCGAYIGFAPDCSGLAAGQAQCIIDNTASACAVYGGAGADAGPQGYAAYQTCVQKLQTADAGHD